MHLVKNILLQFLLFFVLTVSGQNTEVVLLISDAVSGEKLEFAEVFNLRNVSGTITDVHGMAKLLHVRGGDSIRISYIGYETAIIKFQSEKNRVEVRLTASVQLLPELIVSAEDDYLYHLLRKCGQNNKEKLASSKAYFLLETKHNQETVEMIEAYYNAEVKAYDLKDLYIKNGRLGLKTYENDHLFVSLSTTNVILKHSISKNNGEFPANPFSLGVKEMKEKYDLTIFRTLVKEGVKYFEIKFEPKKHLHSLFKGTVWIDVQSEKIVKLDLQIENAGISPIIPINPEDSLQNINLKLSLRYAKHKGVYALRSLYLDYGFNYVHHNQKQFPFTASAKLFLYDYEERFELPSHNVIIDNYQKDYRYLNLLPYNAMFWQRMHEFRINTNREAAEKFFNENAVVSQDQLFKTSFINENQQMGFFSNPFLHWSKDRMLVKEATSEMALRKRQSGAFKSDLYQLDLDIFLDYNIFDDTLYYFSTSYLDQSNSFYYLDVLPSSHAFINMAFDISEIERRKFMKECSSMTIPEAKASYKNLQNRLKGELKKFEKETFLGSKRGAMEKWNAYIKSELGLDNLMIFTEPTIK